MVILPRYVCTWPPPNDDQLPCSTIVEGERKGGIGGPKNPLPFLQSHGKPLTAATIRAGPDYLEVPFVATHESKRGRGYCRWGVHQATLLMQALYMCMWQK